MGLCITPQGCLVDGLDTVWGGLADGVRRAAGNSVTYLFAWWTTMPSTSVSTVVVHTAQQYVTTWIALPVAILAVLAAVTWSVGTGGPAWLNDLARGVLVFGVTATGSIPIVAALQQWMETLSTGLLSAVPTGDVGRRVLDSLTMPGVEPLQVAFWSTLVYLVSVVQFVVMLFRDGAVLVLTVVLPIAAAGQFSRGSALWLPKVAGWLLAFLTFKPAAALIYYVGFSLLGHSSDISGVASGVCVMATAVFALPALLRLVSFVATSPNPAGSALSTAATGTGIASSIAQLRGRGSTGAAAPAGATVGAATPPAAAATAAVGAVSAATRGATSAVTPQGSKP